MERFGPAQRAGGCSGFERANRGRFLPAAVAAESTLATLGSADPSLTSRLDAGARYLNGFDAPHGALWVSHQIEAVPQYGVSPLIAQVIAFLELGRSDSAHVVLQRIDRRFPSPTLGLFASEMDALLLLFAADSGAGAAATLARLQQLANDTPLAPDLRQRATWMAALVARRLPLVEFARDTGIGGPLGEVLAAVDAAEHGDPRSALRRTEALEALSVWRVPDPCFRTVLHLLRAEWSERLGDRDAAVRELRWYQNSDQAMYPHFDPQPMEVDWAFGPLARWRQARLLAEMGRGAGDRCALLSDVARLWKDGAGVFAARADSASREAAALKCRPGA